MNTYISPELQIHQIVEQAKSALSEIVRDIPRSLKDHMAALRVTTPAAPAITPSPSHATMGVQKHDA